MATAFKKHSSVVIEEDNDESSNISDSEYESAVDATQNISNDEQESEEQEDDNSVSNSATEDDNDNDENSVDEITNDANPGWADCMAKILKTKKTDSKSSVVLSKAKKITDVKRKQKETVVDFEIVENGEKKSQLDDLEKKLGPDNEEEPSLKKRKEQHPNLRVKPNVLEKNREKLLSKIATKGVVQLFNAVRTQQKDLETKMIEAGPTERKKEKVLKSLDKSKFLDMLSGQKKKVKAETEIKDEVKKEEKSSWNVFRDDFMGSAKMKDWDKKEEESDDDEEEMSDSSLE